MATNKPFTPYYQTYLIPKQIASEIYASNLLEFQKACGLYKSILDKNLGGIFCLNDHCRTVFMVEITLDGNRWGATPKMFDSEEAAQNEGGEIRQKYPFVCGCRVITRKIEENS